MEATTLDEAVNSITEPEVTEPTGDDNLREAVDTIVEGAGDDLSEDDGEMEEGADDIEASDVDDDIEDDDQIDDEDHVEAEVEDTNTFSVKVDGKDENWTLDQLKQSAAGQAAINKRFQENSEARKGLENDRQALLQQQAQVMQLFQNAQNGGFQAPTAPSQELFDSDPIGYMQEKMTYDNAMLGYNQNQQNIQRMQQERSQQNEQAHQAYLVDQRAALNEFIPDFSHPEKGVKLQADLTALGQEYGFSTEEMEHVSDARYIRALNDARKYRAIVSKRAVAQEKGAKARPVLKAGKAQRPDGNAAKHKKAQQRLQNTGSIEDALDLILNQ